MREQHQFLEFHDGCSRHLEFCLSSVYLYHICVVIQSRHIPTKLNDRAASVFSKSKMAAVAILEVIFRLNRHSEICIDSPEVLVRNVAFFGILRIVYYWVANSDVLAKCRLDWLWIKELYYVPVIFTDKGFYR